MSDYSQHFIGVWREGRWILLPIFYFIFLTLIFPSWTAEDAYIMLRYARNIANGFWFIYNPGDPPVWGATSYLMTVSLAGLIRLGLSPVMASISFGYLQTIFLIIIVYGIARRLLTLSIFSSVLSCMILASGQVVVLTLMGFDAILFGILMVLSFGISLWILRIPASDTVPHTAVYSLGLVSILLSLTRPEGALVAVAAFLVILWQRRQLLRSKPFLITGIIFVCSLIGFYAWTTIYFGHLLPNPFYVKTGSMLLYPSSFLLLGAFLSYYVVCILVIGAWLVRIERTTRRFYLVVLIPAILFALAYLAIHQVQNIWLRFQFPLAGILLILFALALDHFLPGLPRSLSVSSPFRNRTRIIAVVIIVATLLMPLVRLTTGAPWGEMPDALQVGITLSQYNDRGYTMIVTEAGRLPFYADWRTIDAYGLNNPFIAHNGLTEEYIAQNNPELIMFWNAKYSDYNSEWAASTDDWDIMCKTLYLYAIDNNYTLACIFRAYLRMGPIVYHEGYQWYFVRPDFADSAVILNDLRTIPVLDYIYPPV